MLLLLIRSETHLRHISVYLIWSNRGSLLKVYDLWLLDILLSLRHNYFWVISRYWSPSLSMRSCRLINPFEKLALVIQVYVTSFHIYTVQSLFKFSRLIQHLCLTLVACLGLLILVWYIDLFSLNEKPVSFILLNVFRFKISPLISHVRSLNEARSHCLWVIFNQTSLLLLLDIEHKYVFYSSSLTLIILSFVLRRFLVRFYWEVFIIKTMLKSIDLFFQLDFG